MRRRVFSASALIPALVVMPLWLIACDRAEEEAGKITVLRNLDELIQAAEAVEVIDFGELYPEASSCPDQDAPAGLVEIPSPLVVKGTSFAQEQCLRALLCHTPACRTRPDNPEGGNMVLGLNTGGTIIFPSRTNVAMLTLEGIRDVTVTFTLTMHSQDGKRALLTGGVVANGVEYVGFSVPAGIRSIEVRELTSGPLAVSTVYVSK